MAFVPFPVAPASPRQSRPMHGFGEDKLSSVPLVPCKSIRNCPKRRRWRHCAILMFHPIAGQPRNCLRPTDRFFLRAAGNSDVPAKTDGRTGQCASQCGLTTIPKSVSRNKDLFTSWMYM